VYYPSSMLMALADERVRDVDRRAFHAGLRSLEPGRVRSSRAPAWPARAFAALSGRPTARAHS
jgi:hypothetical protein